MGATVFVKVLGFREVERHAINTLFRLSAGRTVSYNLWTPDSPEPPRLVLVDNDSAERELVNAGPDWTGLKVICVGAVRSAHASRHFERPLQWPSILQSMDDLCAAIGQQEVVTDFQDTETGLSSASTGQAVLLVDASLEDRMYLRARLALAGRTDVDDAADSARALDLARQRHYDLAIVGLPAGEGDCWGLVRTLLALEPAIGSVIITTSDKSIKTREQARAIGCHGLLEKPYDPLHVVELLETL